MVPRACRLVAVLAIGVVLVGLTLPAPCEGGPCMKFKSGMSISDCPDSGCGKEPKLNLVKNRTDGHPTRLRWTSRTSSR